MSISYFPPSVSLDEVVTPAASASLSSTNNVCLVGQTQGYTVETQTLVVASGLNPFKVIVLVSGETILPVSGTQTFVSVINKINPVLGNAPADNQGTYGYGQGTGPSDDFTAVLDSSGTFITVTPLSQGVLQNGGIIQFTYNVLPQNYFQARVFQSLQAVINTYGAAFNAQGGVVTPISAAAQFAFNNGLNQLIIQPLFVYSNTNVPTLPTALQATQIATWQNALSALQSVTSVNYVVPVAGQSDPFSSDAVVANIQSAVANYVLTMATSNGQEVFAVVGEDSTSNQGYATDATLTSHVTTLRSYAGGAIAENIIFCSPSVFTLPNSSANAPSSPTLNLGGQYVAASLAAFIAAGPVSGPITRQALAGWTGTPIFQTQAQQNADAQAGMCVLANNNGNLIVRHAITVDDSSLDRRGINSVRSKFYMLQTLYNAYNNQIIGQIPANGNAIVIIEALTYSLLSQMTTGQIINGFNNLTVTIPANAPTTAQVVFSWAPIYSLDYIDIIFSLDLTGTQPVSSSTVAPTS